MQPSSFNSPRNDNTTQSTLVTELDQIIQAIRQTILQYFPREINQDIIGAEEEQLRSNQNSPLILENNITNESSPVRNSYHPQDDATVIRVDNEVLIQEGTFQSETVNIAPPQTHEIHLEHLPPIVYNDEDRNDGWITEDEDIEDEEPEEPEVLSVFQRNREIMDGFQNQQIAPISEQLNALRFEQRVYINLGIVYALHREPLSAISQDSEDNEDSIFSANSAISQYTDGFPETPEFQEPLFRTVRIEQATFQVEMLAAHRHDDNLSGDEDDHIESDTDSVMSN